MFSPGIPQVNASPLARRIRLSSSRESPYRGGLRTTFQISSEIAPQVSFKLPPSGYPGVLGGCATGQRPSPLRVKIHAHHEAAGASSPGLKQTELEFFLEPEALSF